MDYSNTSREPWINTAEFSRLLLQGAFGDLIGYAHQFNAHGYCRFRPDDEHWQANILKIGDALCDSTNTLPTELQEKASHAFIEDDPPFSPEALNIATHNQIYTLLRGLYGREPFPYSITSSIIPNNQKFTVSTCATSPPGFCCSVWIALGDLEITVHSSAFKLYGQPSPENLQNFDAPNFSSEFIEVGYVAPKSSSALHASYPDEYVKILLTAGEALLIHDSLSNHIWPSSTQFYSSKIQIVQYSFAGCSYNISIHDVASATQKRTIPCVDLSLNKKRPTINDRLFYFAKLKDIPEIAEPKEGVDLTRKALIDQPSFADILSSGSFGAYANIASSLNSNGYALLKINDQTWLSLLDQVRAKLEPMVDLDLLSQGKLESTRFQDAWLHHHIDPVREVACHPEILLALQILYGRPAFPFQTLNFPNGTAQHFHSDAVHFHSLPHGFMCGVWVALEDVNPNSGPLIYYPETHQLPYLKAKDLDLTVSNINESAAPQCFFEPIWRKWIENDKYPAQYFHANKGDVLIWHANLLHGGSPVKNKTLSRWSQVTHYYFENCFYTTPIFDAVDSPPLGPQWRNPLNLLNSPVLTD